MIKYEVNEQNRTVKAVISDCKGDVVNRIKRLSKSLATDPEVVKAATISDNFSAVAKCHPDDTFDQKVGKGIAKKRLLNKYHAARAKACNRVEKVVDKLLSDVSSGVSKDTQHNIGMIRKYNK